jgi:hypothetical protein
MDRYCVREEMCQDRTVTANRDYCKIKRTAVRLALWPKLLSAHRFLGRYRRSLFTIRETIRPPARLFSHDYKVD